MLVQQKSETEQKLHTLCTTTAHPPRFDYYIIIYKMMCLRFNSNCLYILMKAICVNYLNNNSSVSQ